MPPQAGDSRYTPMSYLQKTRKENRPWTEPENTEDDYHHVQNRLASTVIGVRKGSRDEHFQSRVADKREKYRAMLKGEHEQQQQQQQQLENDFFQGHSDDPFIFDYDGSNSSPNGDFWSGGSGRPTQPPASPVRNPQRSNSFSASPRRDSAPLPSTRQHERSNSVSFVSPPPVVHVVPPSPPPPARVQLEAPAIQAPVPSINPRISPTLVKAEARAARQKRLAAQKAHYKVQQAANLQFLRQPMVASNENSTSSLHSARSSGSNSIVAKPAAVGRSGSDASEVLHRRVRDLRGCLEADQEEKERLEELRSRRLADERAIKLGQEKLAKLYEEQEERQRQEWMEGRERKQRDLEEYNRAQLESAEAARRSYAEDRRMQQQIRMHSMDILQAERGTRNPVSPPRKISRKPKSAKRRLRGNGARLTLMQEFQEVVRESGIFRSCAACFGEEDFQESLRTVPSASSSTKRHKLRSPDSSDSSDDRMAPE
jgi:hypothetical protein